MTYRTLFPRTPLWTDASERWPCGRHYEVLQLLVLEFSSDYTIRCNGGSVTASSLVLLLRSAYFKRLLLHPSSADSQAHSHYLGYPVDVVSPLVTYLHTDTFGLEPTVPLRSVQEMLKLIDELEPVEMRKLKNGIAAYVHRQFETVMLR